MCLAWAGAQGGCWLVKFQPLWHLACSLSTFLTHDTHPSTSPASRSGHLFEKNGTTESYELLVPKRTALRHRVPDADEGLLSFIAYLLHIDPHKRPTAAEALHHPWLQYEYPPEV